MVRVSIQGTQEAQRKNLKMIRALQPANGLGDAVRYATTYLHRFVVIATHVDTGALRASHRIFVYGPAEYHIEIDEKSPGFQRYTNKAGRGQKRASRNVTPPSEYGPYEHDRGGSHAFYEKPYNEKGDRAIEVGISAMVRILNS